MNAADKEIVTRFEDLDMSVDDIAVDLGVEPDAVRLSLTQNSARYRNAVKRGERGEDEVFTDMICNRAARVMEQLLDSEEDIVRFRASKFVIDEYKGRNDAAVRGLKAAQQLGVSVLQINEAIRKARLMRLRNAEQPAAIDVTSSSSLSNDNKQLEMVLAK